MRITVEEPYFFSHGDEDQFFAWLKSIPAVREVEGTPIGLDVVVKRRRLSSNDLRELIALFHRYGLDSGLLRQFYSPQHEWMKNPKAYWYKSIFGRASLRSRK